MGVLDRLRAQTAPTVVKAPAPKPKDPTQHRPNGQFAPGNKVAISKTGFADLASMVRHRTENGDRLFDWIMDIAAGLAPIPVKERDKETGEIILRPASGLPTAADRLRAITTLKIWGWGKEKETIEINADVKTSSVSFDLTKLSPADLRAYLEISRKARALPEVVEGQSVEVQEGDARPELLGGDALLQLRSEQAEQQAVLDLRAEADSSITGSAGTTDGPGGDQRPEGMAAPVQAAD